MLMTFGETNSKSWKYIVTSNYILLGGILLKKKLLLSLMVISLMLVSAGVGAYAATKKMTLIVNGTVAKVDPIIQNNTTYVPLRAAAELLGASVNLDSKTNTVTVTGKGNITVDTYYAGDFVFTQLSVKPNVLDMWDVDVEVANNGSKAISGANLTAVFYDGSGKRLGTATGSIMGLGIKETKVMSFHSSDDLTGYKTVKFQTDIVNYK